MPESNSLPMDGPSSLPDVTVWISLSLFVQATESPAFILIGFGLYDLSLFIPTMDAFWIPSVDAVLSSDDDKDA